jgi:hypothetical protein
MLDLLFIFLYIVIDSFVKSPTSALCCILRHCSVLYVRFVPQDLRALNLDLFTLPSDFDFFRIDQLYQFHK